MARLVDEIGPLSPRRRKRGRPDDAYGVLVRAITGQQLSTKAAATIYGRLTDHFGGHTPAPEQIIATELNVREVEALVSGGADIGANDGGSSFRKVREKDPDTKAFEKELSDSLGLRVEIKRGSGESGNLVIKYGNFDQLEYIRMRLSGIPSG